MTERSTEELFLEIREPLILISIRIGVCEVGDVYDAVRFAWRVDVNRARKYSLALAHDRDTVLGAFRIREWLPASDTTFANCKNFLGKDLSKLYGFVGDVAELQVRCVYEGRKVPGKFLTRYPIRYCEPD